MKATLFFDTNIFNGVFFLHFNKKIHLLIMYAIAEFDRNPLDRWSELCCMIIVLQIGKFIFFQL